MAGPPHRRVLVGLAVLIIGAVAVWWALQPAATPAAQPVVAEVSPVIAPPGPLAVSTEVARPPAPVASPVQAAPEPSPAPVLQNTQTPTATPAREPRTSAERERVPRASPRNGVQPAVTAPRDAVRPLPTEPAAARPVVAAAAPTPVPVPAPAQTVDQTCADSSNFLTRDLCRVRACRSAAMASDPVCVRFREMETANRSRMDQ